LSIAKRHIFPRKGHRHVLGSGVEYTRVGLEFGPNFLGGCKCLFIRMKWEEGQNRLTVTKAQGSATPAHLFILGKWNWGAENMHLCGSCGQQGPIQTRAKSCWILHDHRPYQGITYFCWSRHSNEEISILFQRGVKVTPPHPPD
jgi:hypothetical protein